MYTPGLTVTAATTHRVRRQLPIPGTVHVEVGQRVAAGDVVASTAMPGPVVPVNVARRLGVAPADVPECLLKDEGESLEAGELLARSPGFFGFFRQDFASPAAGTIETVSHITGQVILRGAAIPVEVPAYLAGRVVEVHPELGCDIEATAAVVQGIFGIGGETNGPLRRIAEQPAEAVAPSSIPDDAAGQVLVGGGRASIAAVRRAIEVGAAALVCGGIDDADLKALLGYDLGVAITGTERIGLTLVITEGFGDIAMAARTFDLLSSLAGREASVNGTTQIRAGVLRPEILVPVDSPTVEATAAAGQLEPGAAVRIIRDPYFGWLGHVKELPTQPHVLESQSRARVLVVETSDRGEVTVPRANVELIES